MTPEPHMDAQIDYILHRHRQGLERLQNIEEQFGPLIEFGQLSPYMGRQLTDRLVSLEKFVDPNTLSSESALTYSVRQGGDFRERSNNVAMRLLQQTTDSLGVLFDGSGRKRLELAWRDLKSMSAEGAHGQNLVNERLRQRLSVEGQVVRDAGSTAENDFGILTTLVTNRVITSGRSITAVEAAMSPLRSVRADRLDERLATFLKAVGQIQTVFDLAGSNTMHHCYLGGLKLVRYVPPSDSKVKGNFVSKLVGIVLDKLDKARHTEAAYNTHPTSEDVVPVRIGNVRVLSRPDCERYLNTVEDLIGFGELVQKNIKTMKHTGARDIRVAMLNLLDAYDNNGIEIESDVRRELDVALQYLNADLVQHLEVLPGAMAIALRTIDTLTSYVRASVEAHNKS